jgi:type IV pilus biogenesis protein CpaD/CtpE
VLRFSLAGALALALAGCDSKPAGPVYVPVTGSITLDGAPLAQAVVSIIPEAGGRAQSATTDAQGNFKTESVEGNHNVAVSKVETTGSAPMSSDGLSPDFSTASPPKVKAIVPERYSRMETSALTVKVPPGGGDIGPIPLSTK